MAGPSTLLPPLEFHRGMLREATSGQLKEILIQLEGSGSAYDNDIKLGIKELIKLYINSKENKDTTTHCEARYLIVELFTRFNNKRLLKKFLNEQVSKTNIVTEIITNHTQYVLDKIRETKICDLRECNEFVHFVSVVQTSQNYDVEANFKPLFPMYMSLYDSYAIYASQIKQDVLPEIEELNVLMNSVLKQILPVFVKHTTFLEEIKDKYLQSMLMYSYILLFNGKIGFDLRMKVCLIFVYSFNVLEGEKLSVAQLISKDCSQFTWTTNESIPPDYHIILYSAILNVLPENKLLSEEVDGKPLVCVLYNGFLETAMSNEGNTQIIIETSKTLCQLARHLKKIPIENLEPLFLEGLFFVWSHADHFADTVRAYSKHFFEDLVCLAASYHDKGSSQLAEILLQKIAEIPDTSNLKFFAYENLARYFGCEFLLQSCHKLPETLLELMEFPTIGEQVCKTYINLMDTGFRSADAVDKENLYTEWAKTWVFPVVQSMNFSKVCRIFYQKIITAAFKLQPAILRMIYPNDFVGSTGESAILLHCLNYARKNGIELCVERDSNLYWRGLIDKQKMEMFMIHQDEQIRLLVLASVTESLKSTELFLDWEFIFLINFIHYNITAQSPNVRKQIISYYKKVLVRYDAGYKVIVRSVDRLTKCLETTNPTVADCPPPPPQNLESTIENKVINKNKILLTNNKDQTEFLLLYQELKKSYRRFICKFAKILIGNLSYDSNFPRRSTSLELLLVVKDILSSEEWTSCWTDDDVKNSHNILFDTYENNKKMAVALLKTLPPHYLGFLNCNFTFKYLQRSFDLALDVKPSKTITAAYLFEMCTYSPRFYKIVHCDHPGAHTDACEAEKADYDPTLDMVILLTKKFMNHSSEINLESADNMAKSSIYGFILSIRHMIENRDLSKENKNYAGIFDHLVSTCFEIQKKIMPVVCSQSPEGYLPEGSEDMSETDESSRAQMVLVYAWRTMKEMTLLLAEIVKQCIVLEEKIDMLPEHILFRIGEFFVNVFIQSKHRGVFEQAYVGFSTICEKFWTCKKESIRSLPKRWLEYALDLCTGREESDDLVATRRSAGLPFLILSIVTNVPDPNYFSNAMRTLLECATNYEQTPNEIRMHCMNVLRAIYRHSKLGEMVGTFVSSGVILAINGYKSEDWGVRNSSTLLFATLITRIFGVLRTTDSEDVSIKNKLTLRVFCMRYPDLYTFLLQTLSDECQKSDSLVLHPILMILARIYGSNFEENGSKMEELLPHVSKCLSNPVFRTRELAARASVPLIDPNQINNHLERCFKNISENDIGDNECHGILLQMYHLITKSNITDFPQSHYLASAVCGDRLWNEAGKRFSYMTVNLFTEIVTYLLMFCGDFEDLHWLKQIVHNLSKQMRKNLPASDWRSKFASTRFILAYFIIINKLEETDVTYLTITHEVMSYMYNGTMPFMKKFALYFMIALNQTLQVYLDASNFKLHPLFSLKEIEIPVEITSLVSTFDRLAIEKILRNIHPFMKSFLVEELKREHYIKGDDRILMFLLLDFYPCAMRFLRLSKQETLNTLLSYCDCDNEEQISAVLACISTFLSEVDYNLLRYDKLVNVLAKSASPAALLHRRLAVCDFLCRNYHLYCNEEPILRGDQLCLVFSMVLVLLEDDDEDVRNAMSNFENALKVRIRIDSSSNQTISGHKWPVVPEKAKEDLIHLSMVLLPEDTAICFIFSWACRYFPDPSSESNEYEIFERGGLNQYAENTPLIDICSRVLTKRLWTLPFGLSYEDKSIFLEEQTQAVTLTLLNALMKYDSPMMLQKTKMSVICVLKSLYKFLENVQVSDAFVTSFRTYLNETILNYLTTHLEHGDLFCVKKIIKKLYDPVFRPRK